MSVPVNAIADLLAQRTGRSWDVESLRLGSFCDTWSAEGDGRLFLKSASGERGTMLEAEADGLQALATTGTIRVPAVVGCWSEPAGDFTLLAMEWLDLAPPDTGFGDRFGAALAALHRVTLSTRAYGWHRDNFLGATPQRNAWSSHGNGAGWIDFYGTRRLEALCAHLEATNAAQPLVTAVRSVIRRLPGFFAADAYEPTPSLIHGDLWSGNWGMLTDGTPVIYDPAVSCSDHEMELAMMELFGGLPGRFLAAYGQVAPLASGYTHRRSLYQLYHLLNHAILFGGAYLSQAQLLAQRLLRTTAA